MIGDAVGGLQVADRRRRGSEAVNARREVALNNARNVGVAVRDDDHRLVDRRPSINEIAKPPGGPGRITLELSDGVATEPASALQRWQLAIGVAASERGADAERVVNPARQREVVERDERRHLAGADRLQNFAVAADSFWIGLSVKRAKHLGASCGALGQVRRLLREKPAPLKPHAEEVGA